MICPLCQREVQNTCEGCGLWWITPDCCETVELRADGAQTQVQSVVLQPRLFALEVGILLFFAALGGIAIGFTVWAIIQSPSYWSDWVAIVLAVPVGGFVTVLSIIIVAQRFLHALAPSRLRLLDDPSRLHMDIWHTWSGTWEGFRRRSVNISREEIDGVSFSTGQGGDTLLFLKHRSGLLFGTGWGGTRDQAKLHANSILHWLERRPC